MNALGFMPMLSYPTIKSLIRLYAHLSDIPLLILPPLCAGASSSEVPVDIVVRNRDNATADAINSTVTLALPPYVSFGSVAWTNFSEQPAVVVRRHAVHLSWPRIIIGEGLHVQVLLVVDPNNVRGFGAGYGAATTPVFLRATMFQR